VLVSCGPLLVPPRFLLINHCRLNMIGLCRPGSPFSILGQPFLPAPTLCAA
jgi:hypothetical protein